MKIKWSPLVGSASGTTADAVAASWKGIQYIRKHVIPHNPKTPAQTLVRESLARCVPLWRSHHINVKTWLNTYGVDYRMSGFNVFMSKSRALEQAGSLIMPVPANPYCPAPSTLAFAEGIGAGGDIDVTWVDNAPVDYDGIAFAIRRADGNVFNYYTTRASAGEAEVLSGFDAGEDYDCYAWFVNEVAKIHGTPDGDLGVTAKA